MREQKPSQVKQGIASSDGYQLMVVLGDELQIFEVPQSGSATIGRDQSNQIRINHPSVSRAHAILHLGASIVIEDLGGPNGTLVSDAMHQTTPGQTLQTQTLRRLVGSAAELRIGENIMMGAVSAVLRYRPEASSNETIRSGVPSAPVALDSNMRSLHEQAKRAASASINVLILGETGVGKEVLARAIHAASPRAGRPFIGINCAALGEQVLEGELFGYERGSFTGAVQARPGLFEAAQGGSVLLDELGELPLLTQAKLLRVLEERTVMRLGARTARAIDVRFLAATNRDLESEVRRGVFREDLFYRLNGICLTIPPLRLRPLEIEPLTYTFVHAICQALERSPLTISEQVLQVLKAHSWPGNVRELRNVIERAIVLCTDGVIRIEHLPSTLMRRDGPPAEGIVGSVPAPRCPKSVAASLTALDSATFRAQVSALERERIAEALNRCGGNQTRAAKLLGIARRTLLSHLDTLDLPRPRKRRR